MVVNEEPDYFATLAAMNTAGGNDIPEGLRPLAYKTIETHSPTEEQIASMTGSVKGLVSAIIYGAESLRCSPFSEDMAKRPASVLVPIRIAGTTTPHLIQVSALVPSVSHCDTTEWHPHRVLGLSGTSAFTRCESMNSTIMMNDMPLAIIDFPNFPGASVTHLRHVVLDIDPTQKVALYAAYGPDTYKTITGSHRDSISLKSEDSNFCSRTRAAQNNLGISTNNTMTSVFPFMPIPADCNLASQGPIPVTSVDPREWIAQLPLSEDTNLDWLEEDPHFQLFLQAVSLYPEIMCATYHVRALSDMEYKEDYLAARAATLLAVADNESAVSNNESKLIFSSTLELQGERWGKLAPLPPPKHLLTQSTKPSPAGPVRDNLVQPQDPSSNQNHATPFGSTFATSSTLNQTRTPPRGGHSLFQTAITSSNRVHQGAVIPGLQSISVSAIYETLYAGRIATDGVCPELLPLSFARKEDIPLYQKEVATGTMINDSDDTPGYLRSQLEENFAHLIGQAGQGSVDILVQYFSSNFKRANSRSSTGIILPHYVTATFFTNDIWSPLKRGLLYSQPMTVQKTPTEFSTVHLLLLDPSVTTVGSDVCIPTDGFPSADHLVSHIKAVQVFSSWLIERHHCENSILWKGALLVLDLMRTSNLEASWKFPSFPRARVSVGIIDLIANLWSTMASFALATTSQNIHHRFIQGREGTLVPVTTVNPKTASWAASNDQDNNLIDWLKTVHNVFALTEVGQWDPMYCATNQATVTFQHCLLGNLERQKKQKAKPIEDTSTAKRTRSDRN